jgi:hypothetical protein
MISSSLLMFLCVIIKQMDGDELFEFAHSALQRAKKILILVVFFLFPFSKNKNNNRRAT